MAAPKRRPAAASTNGRRMRAPVLLAASLGYQAKIRRKTVAVWLHRPTDNVIRPCAAPHRVVLWPVRPDLDQSARNLGLVGQPAA